MKIVYELLAFWFGSALNKDLFGKNWYLLSPDVVAYLSYFVFFRYAFLTYLVVLTKVIYTELYIFIMFSNFVCTSAYLCRMVGYICNSSIWKAESEDCLGYTVRPYLNKNQKQGKDWYIRKHKLLSLFIICSCIHMPTWLGFTQTIIHWKDAYLVLLFCLVLHWSCI